VIQDKVRRVDRARKAIWRDSGHMLPSSLFLAMICEMLDIGARDMLDDQEEVQ